MNILAFDTCLNKMYVSISKNGNILPSKIIETTKEHYHSAFLISTIRDILKENDLTPNDIEVIATNIGPGSFTGIRACTTVARVFAQAANIKTVGVSSLEILSRLNNTPHPQPLSLKVRGENESKPFPIQHPSSTLIALDARKEMAYVAIFEGKKQIFAPKIMFIDELKELISDGRQFVICDDKLAPVLGGISYQQSNEDLGKFLIEIACEKLQTDIDTNWRNLHPLYIQPPPVTLKK